MRSMAGRQEAPASNGAQDGLRTIEKQEAMRRFVKRTTDKVVPIIYLAAHLAGGGLAPSTPLTTVGLLGSNNLGGPECSTSTSQVVKVNNVYSLEAVQCSGAEAVALVTNNPNGTPGTALEDFIGAGFEYPPYNGGGYTAEEVNQAEGVYYNVVDGRIKGVHIGAGPTD
jgi:hypothetical protein